MRGEETRDISVIRLVRKSREYVHIDKTKGEYDNGMILYVLDIVQRDRDK